MHPDRPASSAAGASALDEQNAACPPRWIFLLPILPVVPCIGLAEAGLQRISSNSGLDPAAIWMCQTMITGYIATLLVTAWGYSFCRLRWPAHPASRQNLAVIAAGVCFGWTMWMAIRWDTVGGNDMIAGFLILSLPTVAFTVPPLWHAILRLRQPRLSLWIVPGFIGVSIGLQFWGTASVSGDMPLIFIANSILIAVAVVVWLIVISLPTAKASAPQNHE